MKRVNDENVPSNRNEKRRWLALLAAAFAGIFSATQAVINSQLGEVVSSASIAAWFSYTSGLILIGSWLSIRWLTRPRSRSSRRAAGAGTPRSRTNVRWWFPLGGAIGATYVLVQTVTVAPLGVAQFVLIVLIGSLWGSAVADRFGISPAGLQKIKKARLGSLFLDSLCSAHNPPHRHP